jgi:hypothetical protein
MTRSEWIRRARAALRRLQAPRARTTLADNVTETALLSEELRRGLACIQYASPARWQGRPVVADPALERLLIRAEAAADGGWSIRG